MTLIRREAMKPRSFTAEEVKAEIELVKGNGGASLEEYASTKIVRFTIVCLAICSVFGCSPYQYRDWSGDSIVFGNIKVTTTDGKDFTRFCASGDLATDDFVPGKRYVSHEVDRDQLVYINRFSDDGSFFAAAAPNEPTHLYLNCTQTLESSMTKETVYQVHVDIGTFITPPQRAASYLGYLTIHLENGGAATASLDKDDDARLVQVPLPVTKLNLPIVRIPLTSIGKPVGWSGSISSNIKIWFP